MNLHSRLAPIAGAATIVAALAATSTPAAAAEADRTMHVYKTPWCGCCTAWTDRIKAAGFTVEITDLEDLSALRRQAAIPEELAGCHVAAIAGYALEGHVPVPAIEKLIAERPAVHGIAVPGMPMGAPGMNDDPSARYDVVTFGFGTTKDSRVFYEAGR